MIRKWYRGHDGKQKATDNFGIIWLADNPEYAQLYADEYGNEGVVSVFYIDESKLNCADTYYNDNFDVYDPDMREVKEYQKEGYNCYTFPVEMGDTDVLALFDESAIVKIEQLNKMNINLNDIKEMVSECLYNIVNNVLYENKSLPKLLYHKSSINNRKSILKNGLIPSVGDSYKAHWDDRDDLVPYVFLYDHNTINDGEYDSTYDDDIYSIDTSKLDIEHLSNDIDSYMHGCFVYDKKIPPKAIHLIYKGSTEDSKNLSSHSYIYKNTNEKI